MLCGEGGGESSGCQCWPQKGARFQSSTVTKNGCCQRCLEAAAAVSRFQCCQGKRAAIHRKCRWLVTGTGHCPPLQLSPPRTKKTDAFGTGEAPRRFHLLRCPDQVRQGATQTNGQSPNECQHRRETLSGGGRFRPQSRRASSLPAGRAARRCSSPST